MFKRLDSSSLSGWASMQKQASKRDADAQMMRLTEG